MRILLAAFGICGILMAQQAPGTISTETKRMPFPAGGTLHLVRSFGYLSVSGWDQPEMEITTTKSLRLALNPLWTGNPANAPRLGQVRVAVERQGTEILVRTDRRSGVDIAYEIHVPRGAKIVVEHGNGNVFVDGVAGDIHATVGQGLISLRLPQQEQYGIDARTRLGDIVSDFPGQKRRRPWIFAHRLAEGADSHHELYLRAGYGDIFILKFRRPVPPAPLTLQ